MRKNHESNTADEDMPTTADVDRNQSGSVNFGKAVGTIATMMTSGNLSTGEMAELRRIAPDQPFTPALWRVLLSLDLDKSPEWYSQQTWERRWATLLMGMAHCIGLHDYNISLGQALAEAGWSELRFVKLMRARDETLEKHLRRVAQFLSSKNQHANWTDVARLLFYQSGKTGEDIRLSISRNYYRTLYKKEQS